MFKTLKVLMTPTKIKLIIPFIFTALISSVQASEQPKVPDPNFQLYILMGQSNMAGRGTCDAESKVAPPRVKMLNKALQWIPATDPLHFDKPSAGVGPGRTFGIQLAKANPDIQIGLIPCAVGGSSIAVWQPGKHNSGTNTNPYDDMLLRVREAQKSGVLKGIIWHQGESDRGRSDYGKALSSLIELVRKDLGVSTLPFIAGELCDWSPESSEKTKQVNHQIHYLENVVKNYAVVAVEGLTDKGDHLHFNTESARKLGQRYAEKMLTLQKSAEKK